MEVLMRNSLAIAAFFVGLCCAAPFATAQTVGIAPPPDEVLTGPDVVVAPPPTAMDVQQIAAANGIVAINRMRLDEGVWKLEGRDVSGRYVHMRVDPVTGEIIRLERGW
jgi:hypothetical protein